MIEQLDYRGKPMHWAPVGVNEDNFLNSIANQDTVCAVLEPGDATRYELIISPASVANAVLRYDRDTARDLLIVIRVRGGDPVGVAIVGEHQLYTIRSFCDNNTWTNMFLTWWFKVLFEKLKEPDPETREEEKPCPGCGTEILVSQGCCDQCAKL